jgi:hypothetical protein
MKGHWQENILWGFAVAGVAWTGLFLWSVITVTYGDHEDLNKHIALVRKESKQTIDRLKEERNTITQTYDALNLQCASKEPVIQTLQGQIHSQQETLNNCLLSIGKSNTPDPLKLTLLRSIVWPNNRIDPDSVKREQAMSGTNLLILVNRPVNCPCDITLVVDQPLLIAPDYEILGVNRMEGYSSHILAQNVARLHVESSSILPTRPLLITAYTKKTIFNASVDGLK